jgi:2,4-dienoyl-CoA reductase-like NADH-dependent reductase (Old Yellow Enzyme family)
MHSKHGQLHMAKPIGLESATPFSLDCGLVLQNRLVKVALAESSCGKHYLPDERLLVLYRA